MSSSFGCTELAESNITCSRVEALPSRRVQFATVASSGASRPCDFISTSCTHNLNRLVCNCTSRIYSVALPGIYHNECRRRAVTVRLRGWPRWRARCAYATVCSRGMHNRAQLFAV